MEVVRSPLIEWGIAELTRPGQPESGDRYVVSPFPSGILVAVVDGLGHGDEAAAAARRAVAALEENAHESVILLVRRCHDFLRRTRGAVMSLASINARDESMTWLGVGNVEGTLIRADHNTVPAYESLLLRAGVIGGQLPPLYGSIVPVARGDTLILLTDGLRAPSVHEIPLGSSPKQIAVHILAKWGKGTDDALVLVARYNGNAP